MACVQPRQCITAGCWGSNAFKSCCGNLYWEEKKQKGSGNTQRVSKVPKILSKMQLPCFRLFLIDLLEPFKKILHSPSRHIKVDGGLPAPVRRSAGINFTLLKFDKHFKKLRQVSCVAIFFFFYFHKTHNSWLISFLSIMRPTCARPHTHTHTLAMLCPVPCQSLCN